MAAQHGPWVSKLVALLGEDPALPAPPPPLELSSPAAERLVRCAEFVTMSGKLVAAVATQFNLLQAACQEARLLPGARVLVDPALARFVPTFVRLLRDDPVAARLVTSLVLRYVEAHALSAHMTRQVEMGKLESIDVEGGRGKFYFLAKVEHYFKGHKLLHQLFLTQAAAISTATLALNPAAPSARPSPQPFPTLGEPRRAAGTGPIQRGADAFVPSTGPLKPRSPTDQQARNPSNFPARKPSDLSAPKPPESTIPKPPDLPPRKPPTILPAKSSDWQGRPRPTQSTPPRTATVTASEVGRQIVGRMEFQVLILEAACNRQLTGSPAMIESLPAPLRVTAHHLAARFASAPLDLVRAQDLLGNYRIAARQLREPKESDQEQFVRALSVLRDAPRRFKDTPILGALLASDTAGR